MKKLLLIALLGLAACAKPSDQQAQGSSVPAQTSKNVNMSVSTCDQIAAAPRENYVISAKIDKKNFILTDEVLYTWNISAGTTTRIEDAEIILDSVCKFTIVSGFVKQIETEEDDKSAIEPASQYQKLKSILEKYSYRGLFNGIKDPVKWQKKVRDEWK